MVVRGGIVLAVILASTAFCFTECYQNGGAFIPGLSSIVNRKTSLSSLRKARPSNSCLQSMKASGMSPEEQKKQALEKARRAQQAAEEAAERALSLRNAANVPSTTPSAKDKGTGTASRTPTRKYSHVFFKASLEKPMGMILEDNDASVGGVYVADITPNSPAGRCEQLQIGAQLVSIGGKMMKGSSFEQIMDALKESESPVQLEFYDGSASSLYAGWGEQAKGAEVTVIPNRPSKQLIDRIRSGL